MASPTPKFTVRHVAFARALFAAIAAVMITFSGDHSAAVGLSVFSGFAVATGLVWVLAAWLVYPAGGRAPAVLLGLVSLAAGLAAGIPGARTPILFFVLVIAWGLLTGVIEGIWGLRQRRAGDLASGRDALTVGVIGVILAIAILCVPVGYETQFVIKEAGQTGTLTGITIAVGIFGGYAAIVAVYEAIVGFSPQHAEIAAEETAPADGAQARIAPGKAQA